MSKCVERHKSVQMEPFIWVGSTPSRHPIIYNTTSIKRKISASFFSFHLSPFSPLSLSSWCPSPSHPSLSRPSLSHFSFPTRSPPLGGLEKICQMQPPPMQLPPRACPDVQPVMNGWWLMMMTVMAWRIDVSPSVSQSVSVYISESISGERS